MLQLSKSEVLFDKESHTYFLEEKKLSGITSMLERQLFARKFDGIPKAVLDNAAERGSYIHECCEIADELGVVPDCEEARNYLNLIKLNCMNIEASEYLVSDNKYFASCIDKVYRVDDVTFHLADIKTTYRLDKEYVRWQLSVYAYLFEFQNHGAKVGDLFAIWLRGNTAELVKLERIPDEVIVDLLSSDAAGKQFVNPYATKDVVKASCSLPERFAEIEEAIANIDYQCKYWEQQKKELSAGIMKEMVKAGAYSWQGERVAFTRRKDSIRKDFDKKAFESDYPELYNKYIKETPVVGNLIIKTL